MTELQKQEYLELHKKCWGYATICGSTDMSCSSCDIGNRLDFLEQGLSNSQLENLKMDVEHMSKEIKKQKMLAEIEEMKKKVENL